MKYHLVQTKVLASEKRAFTSEFLIVNISHNSIFIQYVFRGSRLQESGVSARLQMEPDVRLLPSSAP